MSDIKADKRMMWACRRRAWWLERRARYLELRCWWTWPWGHVWVDTPHDEGMYALRHCHYCTIKDYGNGEQSVGG